MNMRLPAPYEAYAGIQPHQYVTNKQSQGIHTKPHRIYFAILIMQA